MFLLLHVAETVRELVVIGKGLQLEKKGDLISENQVEKSLSYDWSLENFMTLLKDVPLDFITDYLWNYR